MFNKQLKFRKITPVDTRRARHWKYIKVSIVDAKFSMAGSSIAIRVNACFVCRYVSNNRFHRNGLFNLPKDYSPKSRYCCHRSAISFGIGSQYLIYHSIGQPSCQNNTCHQHWLCPNTHHKGHSTIVDLWLRFILCLSELLIACNY